MDVEIVALLLEKSPSLIDTVDDRKWNALHIAASEGFAAIVTQLLDRKPSLAQARNCYRQSPLHLAAENGHDDVVKALLSVSDITAKNLAGSTALHYAAEQGHEAVITTLLACNPDMIRWQNWHGYTPLLAAVHEGQASESVLALLSKRDPSTLRMVNHLSQSPFHVAVAREERHRDASSPAENECG